MKPRPLVLLLLLTMTACTTSAPAPAPATHDLRSLRGTALPEPGEVSPRRTH